MDKTTECLRKAAIKYKEIIDITEKYNRAKSALEHCNKKSNIVGVVIGFSLIAITLSFIIIFIVCILSLF